MSFNIYQLTNDLNNININSNINYPNLTDKYTRTQSLFDNLSDNSSIIISDSDSESESDINTNLKFFKSRESSSIIYINDIISGKDIKEIHNRIIWDDYSLIFLNKWKKHILKIKKSLSIKDDRRKIYDFVYNNLHNGAIILYKLKKDILPLINNIFQEFKIEYNECNFLNKNINKLFNINICKENIIRSYIQKFLTPKTIFLSNLEIIQKNKMRNYFELSRIFYKLISSIKKSKNVTLKKNHISLSKKTIKNKYKK